MGAAEAAVVRLSSSVDGAQDQVARNLAANDSVAVAAYWY